MLVVVSSVKAGLLPSRSVPARRSLEHSRTILPRAAMPGSLSRACASSAAPAWAKLALEMAAPAEPTQLEALFDKLSTCVKNQQHKKALKAADESEWHARGCDGRHQACAGRAAGSEKLIAPATGLPECIQAGRLTCQRLSGATYAAHPFAVHVSGRQRCRQLQLWDRRGERPLRVCTLAWRSSGARSHPCTFALSCCTANSEDLCVAPCSSGHRA